MLGRASECVEIQGTKKYAGHDVIIAVIAQLPIPAREPSVGEWLSLVEHLVRDQGVGGSNPLSPTINNLRVFLHILSPWLRWRDYDPF